MRREGDDPGPERGTGRDRREGSRRRPQRPVPPPRSGISFRQVLIAIVAVILIAFAIANFNSVKVDFLLFDRTLARMVTVIVVAAGLGFVIGYFVGRPGKPAAQVPEATRRGSRLVGVRRPFRAEAHLDVALLRERPVPERQGAPAIRARLRAAISPSGPPRNR